MTITFGPQLIGQTEKTLNDLLHHALAGTGLSEREWVTLRLAHLLEGAVADEAGLVAAVLDRARFPDAAALVAGLAKRGVLRDGRPSEAGHDLVATVTTRTAELAGPVWDGLDPADVSVAERVLNTVLERARAAAARVA